MSGILFRAYYNKYKRITMLILLLIILGAAITIIPKYFFQRDEDLIKKQIYKGARAVESKDALTLKDIISLDYRGFYETSRDDAVMKADSDFKLFENIKIKFKDIKIETDGENKSADVVCEFFVSGMFTGSGLYNRIPFSGIAHPGENKADTAKIKFRKDEDGVWRVTEVEISIPNITTR